MGARNAEKVQTAINDIQESVPKSVSIKFLHIDLGSPASISEAATVFKKYSLRLDILMLNAGIMITLAGLTEDGYEIQFGTNHMGHALLTKLLLPILSSTAALPDSDVRVVILSSEAYTMTSSEGIAWETLKIQANGITTRARYG
jgi:NAD(P)-dependent dehydrogenase (short-subunit alcohol dehydrogenase family)